jgi:hypothetical protein
MLGLLPIVLAGSMIVLAADKVPELNVDQSCRAAGATGVRATVDQNDRACRRNEQDARGKLDQGWGQFSADEGSHCLRLSTYGGTPSYVELLTCLETSKQAGSLARRYPGHRAGN